MLKFVAEGSVAEPEGAGASNGELLKPNGMAGKGWKIGCRCRRLPEFARVQAKTKKTTEDKGNLARPL